MNEAARILTACGMAFGALALACQAPPPPPDDKPTADAPAAKKAPVVVSAAEMLKDYADNEIRASTLYADHRVIVSGFVLTVTTTKSGGVKLELLGSRKPDSIATVNAFFDASFHEAAGKLSKLEAITVDCDCSGQAKGGGDIVLVDCQRAKPAAPAAASATKKR